MAINTQAPRRGRPPTITFERIAEAGIKMGLPHLTFVGVAALLGVSHMALYKHVANLEELKRMVAIEIFNRWQIPSVASDEYDGLESYLLAFTASLRTLVKTYPGLAPYLIRRAAATPAMMANIDDHQTHVARVFGIPKANAQWVLSMVAFHCIAVADTVYSTTAITNNLHPEQHGADNNVDNEELEAEFELGMRTLIAGALLQIKNMNVWPSPHTLERK